MIPSGRILSYNASSVFGYGRDQYVKGNTGQWRGGEKYQLFAYDRSSEPRGTKEAMQASSRENRRKARQIPTPATLAYRWTKQVPLFVRALVIANETMFLAGPPDLVKARKGQGEQAIILENPSEVMDTWEGRKGALLWVVSTRNGKQVVEFKLDTVPVFDGMAAARGRLYISMIHGSVLGLANK